MHSACNTLSHHFHPPQRTFREIMFLQDLNNHDNIIRWERPAPRSARPQRSTRTTHLIHSHFSPLGRPHTAAHGPPRRPRPTTAALRARPSPPTRPRPSPRAARSLGTGC